MWAIYSDGGLAAIGAGPVIIPYLFISQRSKSFYYLFATIVIDALTSISKLNYHEARPIWVSEDVQPYGCSSQYGNPSGHNFTSWGMVITICLDYNREARRNPNMRFSAWYWRLLACCVAFAFAAAIAYSRLFLGVHSLNQVLFGALLGLWFAMSCHFILRDKLIQLANDLISAQETRMKYLLYQSAGLMAAMYAVQIVNYEVVLEF